MADLAMRNRQQPIATREYTQVTGRFFPTARPGRDRRPCLSPSPLPVGGIWWDDGRGRAVVAMTRPVRNLRSADDLLEPAVRETVNALRLGPADAGTARLALALARSIDEMDPEMRAKMIGQTSGALLRVLETLHRRAGEVPRRDSALTRLREARRVPGGVS